MKKKILVLIASVTLIVVLAFMLTSCLSIGMKKNNIVKTIQDNGLDMSYLRTTPMVDGFGSKGYRFDDFMLVTGAVGESANNEDSVENLNKLYIHFAGDDESASWAEEMCKSYLENNQLEKWIVYRFDRVIMIGHYQLVAIIRGY